MISKEECPHCGELMDEISYAQEIREDGSIEVAQTILECKNYDKCPKYTERLEKVVIIERTPEDFNSVDDYFNYKFKK